MIKHMFKHVIVRVLCIGIIFIALACVFRFGVLDMSGGITVSASSLLTNSIDIAELSTAEFKYRGIAEVYTGEDRTKIRCRICYEAVVKAGIDMNKVQFEADRRNKTLIATLPDIELKVTIVDEQSMTLLPSDATIGFDVMLKSSKEDAEREARESEELLNTASENLKAAIEGILYPILKAKGYSLIWK